MTELLDRFNGSSMVDAQSRPARREGMREVDAVNRYRANHSSTAKGRYEGMHVVMRPSRPFAVGERSAHFDTLFAYFIDLVQDPSRARRKDRDVHNRMRQDLQILGCINVRKLATIHLKREWIPSSDLPEDKMIAAKFESWFEQQYRITETLGNLLDAVLDGISIQEVVWKLNESDFSYGIDRMFPCFKDRFVFSKDGRLAMLTRRNVFYGDLVHPWQFIKHVYNISGGSSANPTDEARLYWGQGLEDNLYPNYFFKTVVLNLYTRWLQRLSSGVFVARYPAKNPEARATALNLLEAYQEDEELAYPSGPEWEVDIKEATRAPADTYLSFIEYMDRQMSKAILGSTLIIDQGDVGTQSLGEVHERTTFGRITEFDRLGLVETINRELVPVMAQLNHVPADRCPRFDMPLDETTPATATILEAFVLLQSLGYEISAEMISERTGFRRPKPGETILAVPMMGLEDGSMDGATMESDGGPGSNIDMSTPEGMARMRATIFRTAYQHQSKRTKYQLAAGGLDEPHRHTVNLDKQGNGETTPGPNGHKHEVRCFRCVPIENHSHDVLVSNQDLERVVRALS
jgi:phage gp29-like protein